MNASGYLHPVLSGGQSQAFEKEYFQGKEVEAWKAMNRAGAAVAKQALLDVQESIGEKALSSLLVLVGKGHNGGDALIATRHILSACPGARAVLVFPFGLGHLRPLAQRSLDDLQVAGGSRLSVLSIRRGNVESVLDQLVSKMGPGSIDLCIDGILGMQFRPPLRTPARELLEVVNEMGSITCRIAVDLPSGVGDESDEQTFMANFTYATGIAKTGLFQLSNRETVGRIRYLDLGFFNEPYDSDRSVISETALFFRRGLRATQVHKKTFGHVFIFGGSATMPGAILMTVKAALKSGVGLVTAFVPESVVAEAAAETPEAMWVGLPEIPDHGGLALEGLGLVKQHAKKASAWVLGPGMGNHAETVTLLEEALKLSKAPVLLDADALQSGIVIRDWEDRSCLITPHVGEFNRLLDRPLNTPVEEKEVLQLASQCHCTVLLKGSPTLISSGGTAAYSCSGGPVLARGGSGDILSGLIGGRISIPDTDFQSSILEGAAWQGAAADRLARARGQVSAKATDILGFL